MVVYAREYGGDRNGEKLVDLVDEFGGRIKKNWLGCGEWEEKCQGWILGF